MQPAQPHPEPAVVAPALAEGLAYVFAGLYALIARAFLKHPVHVVVINPLCYYLNRSRQRFARLMAHLAAGTLRARTPRPGHQSSGARPTILPRKRGWLLDTLRHEAALYRIYLERALNAPGAAALVAGSPQAQRILRPLCHLLALDHPSVPSLPRRRRKPAPPSGEPPPPRPLRADSPDVAPSVFTPRPSALDSLCPRMLTRWPFIHLRAAPKP